MIMKFKNKDDFGIYEKECNSFAISWESEFKIKIKKYIVDVKPEIIFYFWHNKYSVLENYGVLFSPNMNCVTNTPEVLKFNYTYYLYRKLGGVSLYPVNESPCNKTKAIIDALANYKN